MVAKIGRSIPQAVQAEFSDWEEKLRDLAESKEQESWIEGGLKTLENESNQSSR